MAGDGLNVSAQYPPEHVWNALTKDQQEELIKRYMVAARLGTKLAEVLLKELI